MKGGWSLLASLGLAVLLASSDGWAADRVALVIGNDSYTAMPKLRNARNDATDVAAALRDELGFTLIGNGPQLDKSRAQMLELLETFSTRLQPEDVALFYFAGHGVAEDGTNWLIPTDDGAIQYREDVTERAVSQRSVLTRIESRGAAGINLVILDACRNNPLPSRSGDRSAGVRGLLRRPAPFGTFIAYAADQGQTAADAAGRNGLFTGELLKRILTPGLRVDDLFQEVGTAVYQASRGAQSPAIESKIKGGSFYFKPVAAAPAIARLNPVPNAELLAFQAAQSANSVEGWEIFKRSYPGSTYVAAAEIQLAALTRPESSAPTHPAPLQSTVSSPADASEQAFSSFRDCPDCPEMIRIPAGNFRMGDVSGFGDKNEKPVHTVTVPAFSVGKYEVTFAEWDACVSAQGCSTRPDDEGWGRGRRPVINVSWNDAQQYAQWLSRKTGRIYRLLSEAEWEYVARDGFSSEFESLKLYGMTGCSSAHYGRQKKGECGNDQKTAPVGSYVATMWGLHDVYGNVWEWTQDCWNDSYVGAPTNGGPWTSDECSRRVVRGGSWASFVYDLLPSHRMWSPARIAIDSQGFRVARTD